MAEVSQSIFDPSLVTAAENYLISTDRLLGDIIKNQKISIVTPEFNYFESLCSSIISQQVSLAAAKAIFERFKTLSNLDPRIVNTLSIDELRSVGVSKQKASYISDLSQKFIENPDTYQHLDNLSDPEITHELTKIHGIGIWTAQMFLIFSLGRSDIFAGGDLGLRRAIEKMLNLPPQLTPKEAEKIASAWAPYRSIASLHLWKSLDNVPK